MKFPENATKILWLRNLVQTPRDRVSFRNSRIWGAYTEFSLITDVCSCCSITNYNTINHYSLHFCIPERYTTLVYLLSPRLVFFLILQHYFLIPLHTRYTPIVYHISITTTMRFSTAIALFAGLAAAQTTECPAAS